MTRRTLALALLLSCSSRIVGGVATTEGAAPRPRVIDCATGGDTAVPTTPAVYERLSTTCRGCHGPGAEYPLFATVDAFTAMVVRNPRFIVGGSPSDSALLAMLEGQAGVAQMPPPEAYVTLADRDPTLPSLGALRCWVQALTPVNAAAGPLSGSLNRRLAAELLEKNLLWALGLASSDFSTSGLDYGLQDPDVVFPTSDSNQYRAQQLGAPHWLQGVPRSNEVGLTFVQIMVQLSQAWCAKAAAGSPVFFKYATASEGLGTPAGTAHVRQNAAYLFERVTGEPPSDQTLDGLMTVFGTYAPVSTRTAWAATCAAIVRHPLSLTY